MIQEVVEQMENMVRDVLNNSVHTALPGRILAYDEETGFVDVQPIGSFYCGRVEMDYPVIPAVPLCIMANELGIAVCMPVKVGDACLLVCAEQSLSAFVSETTEAQSNERYQLTNCIAIPGLMRVPVEAQQEANEKDAIVLVNGEKKVIIGLEKIEVTGDTGIEGNIEITGDITVEGNIDTTGSLTVGGAAEVSGGLKVTGRSEFLGGVSITGGLDVDGDITSTGKIEGAE